MITRDNITEVLNNLTREQVNEVMNNSNSDNVGLYINSYGNIYFESIECNNTEREEEIISTGGLVCDKDNLLTIFMECESINPFLLQLI
jgi:hypothetical protein